MLASLFIAYLSFFICSLTQPLIFIYWACIPHSVLHSRAYSFFSLSLSFNHILYSVNFALLVCNSVAYSFIFLTKFFSHSLFRSLFHSHFSVHLLLTHSLTLIRTLSPLSFSPKHLFTHLRSFIIHSAFFFFLLSFTCSLIYSFALTLTHSYSMVHSRTHSSTFLSSLSVLTLTQALTHSCIDLSSPFTRIHSASLQS